MASGNRVEELEKRVKQLEASVTGLTDELIECKERLRTLEDAVDPDVDMDIIEGQATRGSEAAEAADSDKSDASEGGEKDAATDEIIVA